jgi:ABC-type polysaccharide/polyol phosphate export permease
MTTFPKPTYDTDLRKSLILSELTDLYNYRALIFHLIRRNVTSRYKRSVVGIAWTLLDPLITMVVMAIIFSAFFGRSMKAYPVFLLSALIIFNFIQQASTGAIVDLLSGGWLIGKVYMPRTVFAVTSIGSNLVNFFYSLLPLILLLIAFHIPITSALLFIPVALLLIILFALGLGLLFSTFSVFFADMLNVHSILMRLILYLSGTFYLAKNIPENYRSIILFNPVYNLISLFRDPVYFGVMPDSWAISYSVIWSVGLFILGIIVFLRFSEQIAYRI